MTIFDFFGFAPQKASCKYQNSFLRAVKKTLKKLFSLKTSRPENFQTDRQLDHENDDIINVYGYKAIIIRYDANT